MSVNNGHLQIT